MRSCEISLEQLDECGLDFSAAKTEQLCTSAISDLEVKLVHLGETCRPRLALHLWLNGYISTSDP